MALVKITEGGGGGRRAAGSGKTDVIRQAIRHQVTRSCSYRNWVRRQMENMETGNSRRSCLINAAFIQMVGRGRVVERDFDAPTPPSLQRSVVGGTSAGTGTRNTYCSYSLLPNA